MPRSYDIIGIRPGTVVFTSNLPDPAMRLNFTPCALLKWPDPGPGNPIVVARVIVDILCHSARFNVETTIDDLVQLRDALLNYKRSHNKAICFKGCDPSFSFGLFPSANKKEVVLIGASDHEDYSKALLQKDVGRVQDRFRVGVFGTLLFGFPVAEGDLATAASRLSRATARIQRIMK